MSSTAALQPTGCVFKRARFVSSVNCSRNTLAAQRSRRSRHSRRSSGDISARSFASATAFRASEPPDARIASVETLDQSLCQACRRREALKGGGPVKAMLIQNTNPMVVAPDQEKVRQPYRRNRHCGQSSFHIPASLESPRPPTVAPSRPLKSRVHGRVVTHEQ